MSTEIDPKTLQHLAHLSRLKLSANDQQNLRTDLNALLNLLNELKEVDTTNVEPLSNPLEQTQRLREDQPDMPTQREELQACAPNIHNGFYAVPQVIKKI